MTATSKMLTRGVGVAALVALGTVIVLGLFVTPADRVQGEYVRLIYLHPALAWTTYLAFALTAGASALYLYPKTRIPLWDHIAAATAEVGVVFCALTLVTGSPNGRCARPGAG